MGPSVGLIHIRCVARCGSVPLKSFVSARMPVALVTGRGLVLKSLTCAEARTTVCQNRPQISGHFSHNFTCPWSRFSSCGQVGLGQPAPPPPNTHSRTLCRTPPTTLSGTNPSPPTTLFHPPRHPSPTNPSLPFTLRHPLRHPPRHATPHQAHKGGTTHPRPTPCATCHPPHPRAPRVGTATQYTHHGHKGGVGGT